MKPLNLQQAADRDVDAEKKFFLRQLKNMREGQWTGNGQSLYVNINKG